MYMKTRPKASGKKTGGVANLQSSQKILISCACETKLGFVLLFLKNAIRSKGQLTYSLTVHITIVAGVLSYTCTINTEDITL